MKLFSLCAASAAIGSFAAVSASAGTVTLTNDDTISGTVTSQTDAGVTIEHPTLGTLNLDAAQIAGVTLDESDPLYVAPPEPEFFWGWDKSFELGFNGSDGNSEILNFNAGFETGYENDTDRWKIDASYFRSETDGDNSRDEGTLGITKDWLEPDQPYFYFVKARYEYDRFTDYESRVTAAVGTGYEFIDDGEFALLGRAGLGGNFEFGDVNEFIPELVLGIEFEWQIDERSSFSAYNTLLPALDPAFSEFRNNSGIAYKIKIDAARGLSLKIGADNEFNSEVEEPTSRNDFKYFVSLVYDF